MFPWFCFLACFLFFQFCSPAGCHTPVKHDKIRTGVQQSWKGYKHDEIHTDYEF